jgi:uncharacterized protein YjbJ (UPF0337 family)
MDCALGPDARSIRRHVSCSGCIATNFAEAAINALKRRTIMGATSDKLKGRGKQIEGKLTGDKLRMAQGTAQRTKGEIEGAVASAVRDVKGRFGRAKAAVTRAVRSKRAR